MKILDYLNIKMFCIGGLFDGQPANEYCFTLSNVNVIFSAGFNSRYVLICIYVQILG